ncbi:MAG: ABC transporter permease [Candidatus Omnitrophica bacterium]|nr:ABC transporter permease [Candidatus Omnitrophota bacterium]
MKLSSHLRRTVVQILFFGALFGAWQLVTSLGVWDELFFPSPGQVAETLWRGLRDRSLVFATSASLNRFFLGYGISLLIGVPLGLLLGRVRWMDDTIGAVALGLQAMPSICWLPLAVLWFGLSEAAMQFVVIMGSLLALTLATRDGVKAIPRLYIRAGQTMGAKGWKLYVNVVLPASLPGILTGAKLGWSFAWRSLMAAEMLYVSAGLGSTLTMGRELHDMATVVSAMALIMGIGLLFGHLILGRLERLIRIRWGTSS